MKPAPPASCTNLYVNFLGVSCFFLALYIIRLNFPEMSQITRTLWCGVALIVPIMSFDLFKFKVYQNPSARLGQKREPDNIRLGIKMLGLVTTYATIAFFYWVFPEYHYPFYESYMNVASIVVPVLIAFGWYYMMEVDSRMDNPKDGYWQVGCLMLGKWSELDKATLGEHARSWIVKGFFLPLMFTYLMQDITFLIDYDFGKMVDFISFYDFAFVFIYTIDVMFAAYGYFFTFRLLDSHIRSTEPTMVGWVVCLMCYVPFWTSVFYGAYLNYDDGYFWGHMTDKYPIVQMIWGAAILLLSLIYSVSTVCLGYRFSNLTYRGLVSNGPYRWTKHPAYISKNLSWWLISVPFVISDDLGFTLRHCAMLLMVNIIYYLRARTEENHLSHYPEYVEYAHWMNEYGLLARLGRWIPYLRYDEARAKRGHPKIAPLK